MCEPVNSWVLSHTTRFKHRDCSSRARYHMSSCLHPPSTAPRSASHPPTRSPPATRPHHVCLMGGAAADCNARTAGTHTLTHTHTHAHTQNASVPVYGNSPSHGVHEDAVAVRNVNACGANNLTMVLANGEQSIAAGRLPFFTPRRFAARPCAPVPWLVCANDGTALLLPLPPWLPVARQHVAALWLVINGLTSVSTEFDSLRQT